jgi:hypothetical protein
MSALHRFMRNVNYNAGPYNRVGNRSKPFQNTLVELVDPKLNRTLYLVGTTNSNSMLAYRTQKLISGKQMGVREGKRVLPKFIKIKTIYWAFKANKGRFLKGFNIFY